LIQRTRPSDSIIANSLLVADFIDSIGQKRTPEPTNGHGSF
jgi:hypothetical protein